MKKILSLVLALTMVITIFSNISAHAETYHTHYTCGNICDHDTAHDQFTMSVFTTYSSSGRCYLNSNVTMHRDLVIDDDMTLCLNGNTLKFTEDHGIVVSEGATFEICDCVVGGEIWQALNTNSKVCDIISNMGEMYIYGGNIATRGERGIARIYNVGIMEIYGGKFGADIYNDGAMKIYSGNIIGNANYGAALNNEYDGEMYIYDSIIKSDYAVSNFGTMKIYDTILETDLENEINSHEAILNCRSLYLKGVHVKTSLNVAIACCTTSDPMSGRIITPWLNIFDSVVETDASENGIAIDNSGGEMNVYTSTISGKYIGIRSSSSIYGAKCTIREGTVINGGAYGIYNDTTEYAAANTCFSKLAVNDGNIVNSIYINFPETLWYYNTSSTTDIYIDETNFETGIFGYGSSVSCLELKNQDYYLYELGGTIYIDLPIIGANGDDVKWRLSRDGILTIYGNGQMKDFYSTLDRPWHDTKLGIDIKEAIIEDGITHIGMSAFEYLNITKVAIPNSVKTIGNYAFMNCQSLEEVIIPSGITEIPRSAFNQCVLLNKITIPETITSIDDNAFFNCSTLTDVYYSGTKKEWDKISIGNSNGYITNANIHFTGIYSGACGDNLTWTYSDELLTISGEGDMYDYTSSDFPWCDYKDSIKSVVIEEGVTSIGSYAFYTCESLVSVDIPDTITSIGASAFRGCTSVLSIEIPDAVTNIGDYAFRSCKAIETIKIPDGVVNIGFSAFSWCEALTDIDIPDTVKSIGEDAFRGCISLIAIEIPDSVTSIGNNAFRGCSLLHSIKIPDTITDIGTYAFSGCNNLIYVYYGNSGEKWNDITIGKGNDSLLNANIYFTIILFKVSGSFKAFGNDTKTTLIELLNDGEVVDTKIVTGNSGTYTFEDVQEGTYTIRVSKTKHATRDYEIAVAGEDATQDVEIWTYGDVTGDGFLNGIDTLHINRKIAHLSSLFDKGTEELKAYRFKVANVTGAVGTDKVINSSDVLQINRKIAYLSSAFDRIA